MKKIVFMGSDPIAIPMLNHLLANAGGKYELAAVFSQPDRPAGRGKKLSSNPISKWALDRDIILFRPEKRSEHDLEFLIHAQIDLVLVMAYGHIIKQDFLDTPRLGWLNFHASLLPQYRGASPIVGAIASGDHQTGVTLMKMVLEMDAGPVVDKEVVPIQAKDTSDTVRKKIANGCVPLIERNLVKVLEGRVNYRPQNESMVSYTRKIKKGDGRLNFNMPGDLLLRRIQALTPWPGAFFEYKGERIKVASCHVESMIGKAEIGRVLGLKDGTFQIAVSGDQKLCIESFQRPGKKMLIAADFLRGYNIPSGIILESGVSEALVDGEPFPYLTKKS